jgi:hypothetical protein
MAKWWGEGAATGGLDAAHQEELLQRIKARFSSRPTKTTGRWAI